jgi:hypothetical protein
MTKKRLRALVPIGMKAEIGYTGIPLGPLFKSLPSDYKVSRCYSFLIEVRGVPRFGYAVFNTSITRTPLSMEIGDSLALIFLLSTSLTWSISR